MSYKWDLLALLVGLALIGYQVIMYIRTKVPIVMSPKKYIDTLLLDLKKDISTDLVVMEMGSAWANFSFAMEKMGVKNITAYELSPLHVVCCRLKAKYLQSKIIFKQEDFFQADISVAQLIYVFLVPSVVGRLWLKIKKECQPGTIMILLGHELSGEQYFRKIKTNPYKEKSTYFYFYKV